MSELTVLILCLVLDIFAIIYISRDYMTKDAPDWLTLPSIITFGVIGCIIVVDIFELL